ncbi:MAG: peptide ABC transporter substrate-binding protein [Erysipelotrichaceae bacterium]|nr:peptide ABC transporter substrate-binding protein [Erysipelotrichaceae bacterium]MBQ1691793.1 peptide ABC transporter substrate-binding protein [Erysipelotrichaceae bacterium]MBQ1740834.1 peptide ABC transporter substrate-binding protein [Erysipelotrichaceae bacterium]MBQ1776440.1 peptide ABC transporter substrate-binding protein [Erysipelotrichaceae bacterium]MBQ2138982.1 peptide ABC transporter substrate-binding protein [Erysipelotrichaceae bacterium]
MKKLLSLLMIMLLLVGCSGGNNGGGGDAAPADGGSDAVTVVTLQAPTPLISMDPVVVTDGTSFSALTMCFSGLMSLDADGNPVPDAAESFTVSDDGTLYTFKLRDGAVWSNGDPVTANDFVYAWDRMRSEESAADYAFLWDICAVESYKAVDDLTFEVKLSSPSGFFLGLTAFPSMFPINAKVAQEKGDQYALSTGDMVYNGPYTMTGWTAGYSFEFEQNPTYWDAANFDANYAKKVIFREITDTQTALMEYESGNLDTVSLSGEQVDANSSAPGFVNRLAGYMYYLTINMGNNHHNRTGAADLSNANIRKAISFAIDREEIARVLNDGSVAAGGIVPIDLAANPATGADFREDQGYIVSYDEAKAKDFYAKGVAELGHDVTFDLLYGSDEGDSIIKAAEQVQSYLEAVGFTVNLNPKPKKERLDLAGTADDHDYDVMLTRWGPDYADPQTYMDLFLTESVDYNDGGYSSEVYDSLVHDAEFGAGVSDANMRWSLFLEAEKQLIVEDAAVVPVFQAGGAMIISPKISGIEFHSAAVDSYRHIVVK